jgi:lysylphosphatidylglycerol synthetase-like protein (DUF2156 family)
MLDFAVVYSSFFVGLMGLLIGLISGGSSLAWWIRICMGIISGVLTLAEIWLSMAILTEFEELVFLEKTNAVGLVSFYTYLKRHNVPFPGARLWDRIVRAGILGVAYEELENKEQEYENYRRRHIGLTVALIVMSLLAVLLFVTIMGLLFY